MKKRSDAPKEGSRGANGREGRGLLSVAVWPGTFEFLISLALLLAAGGCGKKPDVTTQAAELEKAFPAAAAATDAQPQKQAAGPTPAPTGTHGPTGPSAVSFKGGTGAKGREGLRCGRFCAKAALELNRSGRWWSPFCQTLVALSHPSATSSLMMPKSLGSARQVEVSSLSSVAGSCSPRRAEGSLAEGALSSSTPQRPPCSSWRQ